MTERRNPQGQLVAGPSPDRGRGRRAAPAAALVDDDVRRIVMATANLPVSIPRGRGRRVVTLYEALVREIAGGKVYRRAAVMDFVRLVQQAAAANAQPADVETAPPPAAILRLQEHLDQLRLTAKTAGATPFDRSAVAHYELFLELARTRLLR